MRSAGPHERPLSTAYAATRAQRCMPAGQLVRTLKRTRSTLHAQTRRLCLSGFMSLQTYASEQWLLIFDGLLLDGDCRGDPFDVRMDRRHAFFSSSFSVGLTV